MLPDHIGGEHGSFSIEQRLARWLLMVSDRVTKAELPLTHDTIAKLLGVRRPGVTVATHILEGEHAIRAGRARIEVTDRERLKAFAGQSYGTAEAEYERLIGVSVQGRRVIASASPAAGMASTGLTASGP